MGASSSDIRAGKAFIEVYANKSALARDLKSIGAELKAWGDGLIAAGKRLSMLSLAGIVPMIAATKSWAASGQQLYKLSQQTRMSVESLSSLQYAADKTNVSFDALSGAMAKTDHIAYSAATGSKESATALARLGINAAQLFAMAPDEKFTLLADRISKIQNPVLQAAIGTQVFGDGFRELLPLLNQGGDGIRNFQAEAKKLGLIRSTADAKAANDMAIAWKLLGGAFNQIKIAIGSALAPMLTNLLKWVTAHVRTAAEWVKTNRPLVIQFFQIAAATLGAGVSLIVLGKAFSILGGVVMGLRGVFLGTAHIMGLVTTVLSASAGIVSTAWTVATTVIGAAWAALPVVLLAVTAAGIAGAAALAFAFGKGAASAVGGIFKQVGASLSPFGGWAAQTFSGIYQSAKEAFSDVADEAKGAFSSISASLAAGDIESAIKVALAFVKLEWVKFSNFAMGIWDEFKEYWNTGVMYLGLTFNNAMAQIRTIWGDLLNWLTKKWREWTDSGLTEWLADKLAYVIAPLTGASVEDTQKTIKEDFARSRAAQSKDFSAKDEETAKGAASIEAARKKKEDELFGARGTNAADRASRAKAAQDEIDKARQEFKDAQSHAANEVTRLNKERKKKEEEREQKAPNTDMMLGATKVAGTFNAMAAGQMGGSGPMERVAKHTAAHLKVSELIKKGQDTLIERLRVQ